MREFLLGLYLEHGEREFEFRYWDLHNAGLSQMMGEYIANTEPKVPPYLSKLTPKALALIRNDS